MKDINQKPKYVIVLSTERRDESGEFPDFGRDTKNGEMEIYIGGKVRMEAAVETAKRYSEAEFIMVGGFDQDEQGVFSKAREMALFMRTK